MGVLLLAAWAGCVPEVAVIEGSVSVDVIGIDPAATQLWVYLSGNGQSPIEHKRDLINQRTTTLAFELLTPGSYELTVESYRDSDTTPLQQTLRSEVIVRERERTSVLVKLGEEDRDAGFDDATRSDAMRPDAFHADATLADAALNDIVTADSSGSDSAQPDGSRPDTAVDDVTGADVWLPDSTAVDAGLPPAVTDQVRLYSSAVGNMYKISPSGRHVGLIAPVTSGQRGTLRLVNTAGGLVTLLANDVEFSYLHFSPDGQNLAYVADHPDARSLWLHSLSSGAQRKLGDYVALPHTYQSPFNESGDQVVFIDQHGYYQYHTWSGGRLRVHDVRQDLTVTVDSDVYGVLQSPDGQTVAYSKQLEPDDLRVELHASRPPFTGNVLLGGDMTGGATWLDFVRFTSQNRLLYVDARLAGDDEGKLRSLGPESWSRTTVTESLRCTGYGFRLSSDGTRIVYQSASVLPGSYLWAAAAGGPSTDLGADIYLWWNAPFDVNGLVYYVNFQSSSNPSYGELRHLRASDLSSTTIADVVSELVVSRDRSQLGFIANFDYALKRGALTIYDVATGSSRVVATAARYVGFASDGSWLAYLDNFDAATLSGDLYMMDTQPGAQPVLIAHDVASFRINKERDDLTYTTDYNREVYTWDVHLVSRHGGAATQLFAHKSVLWTVGGDGELLDVSADGRYLAFQVEDYFGDPEADLVVVDLDTGQQVTVEQDQPIARGAYSLWLPSSTTLIYGISSGARAGLWSARIQ